MKAREFVEDIIAQGEPWTDLNFPPEPISLYDREIDTGDISKFRNLKWMRATEIYDEPKVFDDDIHPNDINQGELGDCYFLSVLSSLAVDPHNIG